MTILQDRTHCGAEVRECNGIGHRRSASHEYPSFVSPPPSSVICFRTIRTPFLLHAIFICFRYVISS